jgi:hypothetical protein
MARPARADAAPVEPSTPPAPALAVPAPVPPPAAEASEPDLFDMAFAEAAAAEVEHPTPPASAAVPPKKPAAPAKSEPAAPPAPTEPQPQPAEPLQPVEPPAPAPAAPPEPVKSQQPQPQPPLPPQPLPAPPQPPPQPQLQVPQEPPLFNADELTQLQTFYSDWPDVARATETMIRGILSQTARRMYQDMATSLAPYLQTIDTLADRAQLSELQGHVPDYETVSTQLTTWAAKQPAYLRSAYEHVIKSGTAGEVIDLINRYKQDTMPAPGGQPVPAAPAAQASSPSPAPAPVNPALGLAAARLAPVSTKRTNVVAPPADFDTAFDEFARAS